MAQIIDDLDGNSIIPTDNILPDKLLLIPLQSRPIFPGIFTPLMINAAEDVKKSLPVLILSAPVLTSPLPLTLAITMLTIWFIDGTLRKRVVMILLKFGVVPAAYLMWLRKRPPIIK